MARFISVFIIGNNKFMVDMLCEAFRYFDDINVIGIAKNCFEASRIIRNLKPNIVLLDVVEPDIEEIETLVKALGQRQKKEIPIIVLAEQCDCNNIKKMIAKGVKEYLVKPIDITLLISRIRNAYEENNISKCIEILYNQETRKQIDILTAKLLYKFGMLSCFHGYKYIKKAVCYIVCMGDDCKPFGKVLYPLIAQEYGIKSKKVEYAIRSSIENLWNKAASQNEFPIENKNIIKVFGKKPSSSKFLCTLADMVRDEICKA